MGFMVSFQERTCREVTSTRPQSPALGEELAEPTATRGGRVRVEENRCQRGAEREMVT